LALNYFVLVTVAVDAMVPPQGAPNNKDEEKNFKPFYHASTSIILIPKYDAIQSYVNQEF
jgi:hypothetical protein